MNYVTVDGLAKLKSELEHLEQVERSSITQQIAEARDKGDLSENAEYDAAKEAQGMLEMRISKLKEFIMSSKTIDESTLDTSKVSILTKVKLKNLDNNSELTYMLVPDNEINIKEFKISINTPIAKGLSGKVVGDVAEIKLPNGNTLRFEILDISL
jgi:transcription elongation factor GreA